MSIHDIEDLKSAVMYLLEQAYLSEFVIEGEIRRHPDNLTFDEWYKARIDRD